jgi:hypothetical protein
MVLKTKNYPQIAEYFAENESSCHFCMNYEDFCKIFDEIYFSNFNQAKKYNYLSMTKDKVTSGMRFSESFLSFEAYMNDTISISVYQEHIPNK